MVVVVMEPTLGVCWLGLDAVAEGLVRIFCVFCVFCGFCGFEGFEGVGFPAPFVTVTVETPGFPVFPVFPPPLPWVTVVVTGAGVGFAGAGAVEDVVEPPPPRTVPKRVFTPSTAPLTTSRSPRSLSGRTSRGTFSLRARSTSTALKERNWIAAACARGRRGDLT